jgi:methionyl-tRNA formyltransferase
MGMSSIIFFGNERLATATTTSATTLQALLAAGYDVKAVVSNYEQSTSRNSRELEIAAVATKHDVPLLLPDKPLDILDQLAGLKPEIGVLVAYGRIVPQPLIDLFPHGIINLHPSLLPSHRGPTPIESVILSGELNTGVSIMALAAKMDAGPLYGQQAVTLRSNETKQQLADKLHDAGTAMIIDLLPGILDGSHQATPQNESLASYDELIKKESGIIDWNKSAEQLEHEVRAYAGWPNSRATLGPIEVIITSASVVSETPTSPGTIETQGNRLVVHCGQNKLSLDVLKPAGKNEMTAQAFLSGYGDKLAS